MGTLEQLLKLQPGKAQEQQVELKRLSHQAGEPVVFTLQSLGFNRVAEIKEQNGTEMEVNLQIVLAGVKDPDLRSPQLMERYAAPTPAEMLKAFLLPGEIELLARNIQKLSGYLTGAVKEIKKK